VDMFNEKFGNNRELQDKVFQPQIDGNMP